MHTRQTEFTGCFLAVLMPDGGVIRRWGNMENANQRMNKAGDIMYLDLKLHYKTIVTKPCDTGTKVDTQTNRTESRALQYILTWLDN